MKFKLFLMTVCALLVATTATASTRHGAFALKTGYFMSYENENVANQYDLEVDNHMLIGAEYYAVMRDNTAVSLSLMYSKPDVYGTVYDAANAVWAQYSADMEVWNVALSYIKFNRDAQGSLHHYQGYYYGAGVGYFNRELDQVRVGTSAYHVGDIGDSSADVNLVVGYKYKEGLGMELKWIADEEVILFNVGYWWGD